MISSGELTYPVFISLTGSHITLAGYGKVGMRKLQGLLEGGASSILVLDTKPLSSIAPYNQQILRSPGVRFENRCCQLEDVRKSILVFAATDDPCENARIARMCRQEKTLCNCITTPVNGTFMVPAVARAGALCAAVSTGGASPAFAGFMGREMRDWLQGKARLAWILGRLRPMLLSGGNITSREIFNKIFSSDFNTWLANGDGYKCRQWLEQTFPWLPTRELEIIFAEYAHVFP